jgi:hypothetical protein
VKVLQLGGIAQGNGGPGQPQLLGGALGPMMQTILQTSAMMPAIKEMMKFVDVGSLTGALSKTVQGLGPAVPPAGKLPEPKDDAR